MQANNSFRFKVFSLNVRGIRHQTKRRSIFSFLKDQNANIYFLQETYSEPGDENIWKKEWGGELFFSHGTKHSKGVCILINPTMQLQVECLYSNNSGRIVLITISLNGQKITLCNIYAPNDQANQLQFLPELNNCIIDKTELTSLIVGGDWNCTLTKKDKMGGAPWKPTIYSNLISTTMEMFDLIDIQRVRHPKLRKFTYESKSLRLKSRLDFFLIAKDLTVNIKKSEISPAIAPDHNAIFILLTLPNKCPRGPGFWKFNNTLLKDPQYIDKIRYTYTQACAYYGHLTDRRLFWEMIKMEIRSATITYSKNKSKSIRNREKELIRKLDDLDGTICNNFSSPHIDGVLREYDELKTELQSIYEEKGKQAIFRAKCRWVENGERPTKYFFNLEKRNYNKKTISELRLQDNSTTNNRNVILDQIETYFKNLYTSDYTYSNDEWDSFTLNLKIPRLSDEDRDKLEGPLTYDECKKSNRNFPG